MLEQLYSPLIVQTTEEHAELKIAARGCVTRACLRHYLGFAANQWTMFADESPGRIKPLLYAFRVLLSGIHMMRTGDVNANLPECNALLGADRLAWIDELVARKTTGAEQGTLDGDDADRFEREYTRLRAWLVNEAAASTLPDWPTAEPALKDLLRRIRSAPHLVSCDQRDVESR